MAINGSRKVKVRRSDGVFMRTAVPTLCTVRRPQSCGREEGELATSRGPDTDPADRVHFSITIPTAPRPPTP